MGKKIFKENSIDQKSIEAIAGCIKGMTKGFCEEWFSDLVGGVTDSIIENNRKHNTINDLIKKKNPISNAPSNETIKNNHKNKKKSSLS